MFPRAYFFKNFYVIYLYLKEILIPILGSSFFFILTSFLEISYPQETFEL